jgi:4-amino-4-deoxy-L-arabinose transferase-like glycosyltransferase
MLSLDLANPPQRPAFRRASVAAPRPQSVLAWLPYLWSRVLFPGAAPQAGPWRWQPLLALAVLSGGLLYPCLSFYLFEPDEGRYAQIPREMLERGDWIVPTLQGEPYLDKPPLFYWLVMGAYSLFGYQAWAARLVPALAMHFSLLLTYLLGRRLLGERSALWGAALLTVAPAFLGIGRLLVLDGLLTLWTTLALFSAFLAQRGTRLHGGWWLSTAAACGLGVLTKGPVAPILVIVPLLLQRRLTAAGAPLGWRPWLAFAGIVLAIALPWYVLACCWLPDFARHFLWQHNVLRFVQPFDHIQPVWYYAPILLIGLLPVTLLAPWWLRFLLSSSAADSRRRCPELGYLLLAGLWCVLFFSLSGSKLPTYILPAFPPLCLAAGHFAAHGGLRPRLLQGLVAGSWLLLASAHYGFVPWYAEQRSPMQQFDEVQACCGDPNVPVVCYPRHVDSVAFYVGRSDFRSYRGKQLGPLLDFLDRHPRVVVLFAHRHSLKIVSEYLPPHLRLTTSRPLGLCDMAVVERRGPH